MNADLHRSGIGMTSARTRDRLVRRLQEHGIKDQRVLERIREAPRHLFVDEALATRAYEDTALPIGHGQTISQPFVVAKMTEALLAGGSLDKVLEVGTGCGYQTTVLAPLVGKLFTVERIDALLVKARRRFRELGLRNVRAKHTDGTWGWPEHAPYDGILVAAAPETLPESLLEQLADGGRLVIPVGPPRKQDLLLIERQGQEFIQENLGPVSFVPLLGGKG
ncbi:MAG: protein-L-isoaspartate(D-aspartate) O-methyltransferase [Gammaproteobacteria bacterium]|nr:protein-L-isoaspartate(D-aspartate) O-methyltransferase [Gammaproteobacteria bacterium]